MKALISPNEQIIGVGGLTGARIVQIEPDDMTFDVAEPLLWVSCPDDCEATSWYFTDDLCLPVPV